MACPFLAVGFQPSVPCLSCLVYRMDKVEVRRSNKCFPREIPKNRKVLQAARQAGGPNPWLAATKLAQAGWSSLRLLQRPNGEAQPAARRVVTWRARRQSAHDVVENRPDRAVGCSECWAGRPGWQLLSRHTLAAMPLAVPSTRPSTARISRAEPCKQRRSAKTSEGEAYAACVRCIRWLAGVRRRADERR
jgi:hypothetical protein